MLAALLALAALALSAPPQARAGEAAKDIVDTAVAAGSFKTLAAALTAAGLVDALKGEGPFTVFAPTDAAFAALPAGTLDNLLKPENKEQLKGILLYHVVPGAVRAAEIIEKGSAPATLQGSALKFDAGTQGVRVNGARVTAADIEASNGVIHVIDAVVLPPG
jgi:uncharacterized surface protein with fasciclin (FAS1) repeats